MRYITIRLPLSVIKKEKLVNIKIMEQSLAVIDKKNRVSYWVVNKNHKLCALVNNCYICSKHSCGDIVSLHIIEKYTV